MKKITILGAGNVGRFIGDHLAQNPNYEVVLSDVSDKALEGFKGKGVKADLSNASTIADVIKGSDVVINALPSFLGYTAFEQSVSAGINIVDFSYMTEDPMQLDALAKSKGVTAAVDFGFAPGSCHMFVGRAKKLFGHLKGSIIYVGGLPQKEEDDYKVVFSARDVLEEYSRPARSIKNGKVISEVPFERNLAYEKLLPNGTHINVSGFVSDGLRTMLKMEGVDNLIESTLRYNNHFDNMVALKQNGFFKPENIENTAKVLAEKWKRGPQDRDMSILNVKSFKDRDTIVDHFLFDQYDEKTGVHSMARVTGFPVIVMTEMILNGLMTQTGVLLPEVLGQDDKVFDHVTQKLRDNGITVTETINEPSNIGADSK